jgi:hypothetical protein
MSFYFESIFLCDEKVIGDFKEILEVFPGSKKIKKGEIYLLVTINE